MVDLAKIRKKAKKSVGAGSPAGTRPAEGPAATPEAPAATPEKKLADFLAGAGKRRFETAPPIAASPNEIELLNFILGAERYAIDIDDIAEIINVRPATRVPNAERGIVGIISLRGSIVTLIDVRSKLKQPPRDPSKETRIIVVRDAGGLIGFEVDRVLRPSKIDQASIKPQPVVSPAEASEGIRGVVRGDGALTIVLDLSKVIV